MLMMSASAYGENNLGLTRVKGGLFFVVCGFTNFLLSCSHPGFPVTGASITQCQALCW